MALNPSIALGVKGIEVANPLAQYTQVAQLQAMQNQNQVSQMQLDQMRRDDETLKQIQAKAVEHGGPADINQIANAYINSGNPKFMEFGISLRQKLDARSAFERAMNLGNAPQGAPAAPATNALAPTMQAGALGSGTFGMAPEPRANQLAPAPVAAAPAAPAGRDINALRARRDALLLVDDPRAAAAVQSLNAEIALASKVNTAAPGSAILDSQGRIVGNVPEATSADVRTMKELGYPLTQAGYAAFRDAQRQERILTPAEEAQKIRIANASRAPLQPVAPTITTIEDPNKPGSFLQVDARTYQGGGAGSPGVIGGARPSATAEKLTLQRTQMGKDLGFAITQLSDITKEGGLIDQSTGSGAGRLVDIGARFVGKAMPGDIAIGQIAPIADLVLKMVPRFEGPQSNKDTQSYKEAAGQLADASLPPKIRKEAGKTVLRIMTERKNQFVTTDMAAEGAGAAQIAPPAGFVPDQR
jgi:hypothetical protein